ncbi:hypothetical protein E1263_18695 [Kribbella antibiotica]|uniref:Uncharacterized protein n=1 Tax=Kribbella antibiotica TaxID=190195 RepID=A0A4R4ZL26_9ACTN|nr:DUF6507 family protein [Kribbella antibiotica]TDD58544.1 hypothetical protein E1263_18695 [Kribbella antibiotica]
MDWDINVEGVSKVLTDTGAAATPFDGLAKDYGTKLQTVSEGLNYSSFMVVAAAIGEYAQHWAPTIEAAAKQMSASLMGAQNAVKAYMEGQNEMALNAQRAAGRGEMPVVPGVGAHGRNRAV